MRRLIGAAVAVTALALGCFSAMAGDDENPERRGIGIGPRLRVAGPSAEAANNLTIDRGHSLFITKQALMQTFTFERVMMQLVSTVPGNGGLSADKRKELAAQLFRSWWASAAAEGSAGCNTLENGKQISLNGFPYECPRGESELAKPTFNPFPNGEPAFFPIALVNRLDLMPEDVKVNGNIDPELTGANSYCGEHRVVFGMGPASGVSGRLLIIFEAALPNPSPSLGQRGCLAVAKFWADLSDRSLSDADRVSRLETFYFEGLNNKTFRPVIHHAHFGLPRGQIRTNQFVGGNWTLREFKSELGALGTDQALRLRVDPVNGSPWGSLFSQAFNEGSEAFQRVFEATFVNQVGALAIDEIERFAMSVERRFTPGDADQQDDERFDLAKIFETNGNARLRAAIDAKLAELRQDPSNKVSPNITSTHIVRRAMVNTCAGCHQYGGAEGPLPKVISELGFSRANPNGGKWAKSLGFVHVSEENPQGGAFAISEALRKLFLPQRERKLRDLLALEAPPVRPAR